MEALLAPEWTGYADLAGTWVAVILTLFVFSFLLGDNVLYRLAEHIFVGVAVGYATVVAFHSVLIPKLVTPLMTALGHGEWGQLLALLVPLALGLLLLTKSASRLGPLAWLGSFSVALLLGVGAALAIAGALFGTLLPQVEATADLTGYVSRYGLVWGLISSIVILIGTSGVLLHFYFSANPEGTLARLRTWLVQNWGGLGRWFIYIAFGALLATTFMARLSLLVDRIQFLLDAVRGLVGGWG
jgi:hypothetical protein